MELHPHLALLMAANNNTRGQHTNRGRRRAMERALDKLSKLGNKSADGSLEEHED
jgi:hypothetical protein